MNNRDVSMLILSRPLLKKLQVNFEQRLTGKITTNVFEQSPENNIDTDSDSVLATSLLEQVIEGKCLDVLVNFNRTISCEPSSDKQWMDSLRFSLENYLDKSSDCKVIREEILLAYGIAALQLFVQNNFTGPVSTQETLIPSLNKFFDNQSDSNNYVLKELSVNGEEIYKVTRFPELLLLVKLLFDVLKESEVSIQKWWQFRFLRIYQSVIAERSATVYYRMISLIDDSLKQFEKKLEPLQQQLLYVEASLTCSQFGDISRAKKWLLLAKELSGLEVEMTGALGVRTKFQTTPYAQLVVKVNKQRYSEDRLFNKQTLAELPPDVRLQNETLLPKISFLKIEDQTEDVENDDNDNVIFPEEQAVILALCLHKQKSSAFDDLLKEELVAFAECVLAQPSIWCLQFTALFLRSQQEKKALKKVERAMMQVQSLVDEVNKTPAKENSSRLDLFYYSAVPTYWILEKELAHLLVSLGAIKSALDVFLRLFLWEEVVFCYKQLQRNNKAEEVIREQLEIEETPTLLCLLGDVTKDPAMFEKAWILSNYRSARAQRSLGYYYFERKQFKECIPYFSKAVEISSLDQGVWFSLAHAATQIENYELATKCYHRVISLDPDSFEAWNNLSSAYIKMHQKPRAFKSLQEALKCSFENWKIWENYLLVCVDVGAFEEAIQAWHRLIEIKGKHIDEEVLGILVQAIINDVCDMNQQPASQLTNKTLELIGRITATATNSAKTWSLYGQLLASKKDGKENVETMERVIQNHQKAYRCAVQKSGWEKMAPSCKETLGFVQLLTDAFSTFFNSVTDANRVAALKQSNKLAIRSVVSIVTKQLENDIYGQDQEEIANIVDLLKTKLTELENN